MKPSIRLLAAAALTIAALPADAAIITYVFQGGGTPISYYTHYRQVGGTIEINDTAFGVTGGGSFTLDTAAMPAPDFFSGGYIVYQSAPALWVASAFHVHGFPAPVPSNNGESYGSVQFNETPASSNYLTSDNSTYSSIREPDGSDTVDADGSFNQISGFEILDTFVIDGVFLPWQFDLANAYADSALQHDNYNTAHFEDRIYEQFLARLQIRSLQVFVDGVLYDGDIDPPPPPIDTPEPAALGLLGLGLAALALRRRQARR